MPSTLPSSDNYPLRTLSHRSSSSASIAQLETDAGPSTSRSTRSNGLGYGSLKGKKKRLSEEHPEDGEEAERSALLGRDEENGERLLAHDGVSLPRRLLSLLMERLKLDDRIGNDAVSRPPKQRDKSRTIPLQPTSSKSPYPRNIVRNQKYTIITFLPLVFYQQFKFFFNFYFLVVALSQFIPALKIGYIVTYVAPLAFVIAVTMGKEAYDDYSRYQRDREANSTRYLVLLPQHPSSVHTVSSRENGLAKPGEHSLPRPQTRLTPSAAIKVGDMALLEKNQRVPADMVLLTTSEEEGTCFIRTDQLDGETDWKLKVAVGETQKMGETDVGSAEGTLYGTARAKC